MKHVVLSITLLVLSSCSVLQKRKNIQLDEVRLETSKITKRAFYSAAPERANDLIHVKLDVAFDWKKKQLLGTAYLDLKPYFYPQNTLVLDAKGFDLHRVALVNENGDKIDLPYTYDQLKLNIQLDKEYRRNQSYQIFIKYTAKPDELDIEGGDAITDAKGLYFINSDNSEDKPQQIWTQGETESSSCWFPCIDKPNERCTQEIAITVQEKYTTLSNGILKNSSINTDGTKTDRWVQKEAHAPYLFMMAVGQFSVIEDKWRDLDVNYYVEPDQEKHAKRIFGKTPAMMEFYSQLLGYDYPWEKYAQIIVRDYVSGAMENTTAVIHGEFVYSDEREFIDDPNEMIIAHELFHHWFGDWVTCESWPNLPLNEGFATYGEYLWVEGTYSANEAQRYIHTDLRQYLNESSRKQEQLIRFDNENPNDMFDNHSYAKGGRILHMLRYTLGDEAFFKGLEFYLTEYAKQAVEVHQLRLAMEKVSGKDLNWFFNQWFLAAGHPEIVVKQNIEENKVTLKIEQTQSLETTPLYKIPMEISIYTNGVETRHKIELNQQEESFEFETKSKAELVIFDPTHYLLADVSFNKSDTQWIHQLKTAVHYYDKMEALDSLANSTNFAKRSEAIKTALNDSFWALKVQALEYFDKADPRTRNTLESNLIILASSDPKSDVRALAINCLSTYFDKDENTPSRAHNKLYLKMVKDSSYVVASEALKALLYLDKKTAYKLAKEELSEANKELKTAVIYTIAKNGDLSDRALIHQEYEKADGIEVVGMTNNMLSFLENQTADLYLKSLEVIETKITSLQQWYLRYYTLKILKEYTVELESNSEFSLALKKTYTRLLQTEEDEKVLQYLQAK